MNMKNIIFIVSAAIFSSCSTAYKTGQTPDDVYYSPARVIEEDYREETERNVFADEDEKDNPVFDE